jgi:hypothetical protein
MKRTLILLCLFVGCTSVHRDTVVINGVTKSYEDKKFLGIPVWTKVGEYKSKEQKNDDLDIKKREDQLKTQAKRGTIALWLGAAMFVLALLSAIYAYLSKGWKKFGGLSIACATLGGLCWGMVEWIPYLKWGVLGVAVFGVGLFLHDNKDFEFKKRED